MNLKVGDTFQIDVNQGSRTACIVAVLGDKFLSKSKKAEALEAANELFLHLEKTKRDAA